MLTVRLFFAITFLFLMTGCTTTVEFVRKDLTPRKQAVVRYYPSSSAGSEAKYRAEVDRQAVIFCGGGYDITKEYQARDETGNSAGVGTGVGIGMGAVYLGGASRDTAMYNFVEFACK